MLAALFVMTFIVGLLTGVISAVAICIYIADRADRREPPAKRRHYEKHDGVWSGPILTD